MHEHRDGRGKGHAKKRCRHVALEKTFKGGEERRGKEGRCSRVSRLSWWRSGSIIFKCICMPVCILCVYLISGMEQSGSEV